LFALDIGFWHVALTYTTVGTSTLLANVQVFIVGFFGWLLLKERLSGPYLLGLLLAFGGICLLLLNHEAKEYAPNPWLGDSLSMVVAIWYASYLLIVKLLRRDFRAVEIMLVSSSVAAVCLFIAAILSKETHFTPFYDESTPDEHIKAWYYIILLALIPQCLGQGLIVWALSRLQASFSAVVLLLQPVAAALLGWAMFGELLGTWQIVACGVVLAGIVLARLGTLDAGRNGSDEAA
ncbi:MAG: DMT family transporter, partial [Phycisphaerales bacterium]|nr:DMT family transporter [Phycisphaerales bacterium]